MELLLGFDIGTTNIKGIGIDRDGNVRASASVNYSLMKSPEGHITQDPDDWWEGMRLVISDIGEKIDLGKTVALSLSTQGETLVPVDREGNSVSPAISWMDHRSEKEAEELKGKYSFWFERTGSRMSPYGTLSKIIWLERHDPELFKGVSTFSQVQDYLVRRLTGMPVCDINNASFTHYFDVRNRTWDGEIAEIFGLQGKLPEIAESGTPLGKVKVSAAHELGLPEGIEIVAGGHDQACAAIGGGCSVPGRIMLSTGTAWVLYSVLDNPVFDKDEAIIIYCHASPGKWAFMSPLNGGVVLDYFISEFCAKESQEAERSDLSPYDLLFDGSPDPKGVIFIPHLYGSAAPDWRSNAKGAIWGLTLSHTRRDVAAAIMESLAFEALRNIEVMGRLGVSPEELSMLGGATRSSSWPQMVADVMGLRVMIPRETDAAALGAAFLAGVGCGMASYDSFPEVQATNAFDFSADRHAALMEKFKIYRRAIEFSYSVISGSKDGQ